MNYINYYKNYILAIIIICLCFFIYCHIYHLNKISTDLEILQAEIPSNSKIQDLLVHKQPTIFRQVLYGWDVIIDIHEMPIEDIQNVILQDKQFVKLLHYYLSPYSLFLSYGWKYQITDRVIDNTQHHFYLECHHRHIIAQITGQQRIYLASPNQTEFLEPVVLSPNKELINRKHNPVTFWNKEETSKEPFNKLQYIEIILREGNILYIPRGWWYLQEVEEDGLVLEAVNKSVFNWIV